MTNEATKEFSSKQENNIAHALGWEVVSGSGARPTVPGDIISDDWLGECKTHVTSGQSISFVTDVWKKICDEAMMKHRKPALFVDDGSQNVKKTWVVCYRASINTSNCLLCDISQFKKMRKHITFKDADLKHFIRDLYSNLPDDVADVYDHVIMTADWASTEVAIMTFETFEEIYNK